MWYPILQGLAWRTRDKREDIQQWAMKLLFSSYNLVFKTQNEVLWQTLFWDIIKTILIEIDIQVDSKRSDVERLKQITGVVMGNCIDSVSLYIEDKEKFPLLV